MSDKNLLKRTSRPKIKEVTGNTDTYNANIIPDIWNLYYMKASLIFLDGFKSFTHRGDVEMNANFAKTFLHIM
jgi:hypothetical protein